MDIVVIINVWPDDDNCLAIKQKLEQNYISHEINYMSNKPTESVCIPYLTTMIQSKSTMYYTLETALSAIDTLIEGETNGITN